MSFAVALAIIVYLFLRTGTDLADTISYIGQANILLFLLAVVSFYLSFPVRAIRWRILLGNAGINENTARMPSVAGLLEIILISWFTNCVVPAKLGDAYRGYLLKRNASVGFSTTLGTIIAERFVDMLVLFILLVAAGYRMFRGNIPQEVEYILLGGVALAAIIVVVLIVIKQFGGIVERVLPARFGHIYTSFSEGTLKSFNLKKLPWVVGLSILVWLLEAGRFWAVCQSLGINDVGLAAVLFIALASSLLTTLPITPGGLGVVESALVGILVLLGNLGIIHTMNNELALSVSMLDRVISYWSLIVVGLVLFVITKKK